MGLLMPRSKLSQASEEECKQGVIESKLVKCATSCATIVGT